MGKIIGYARVSSREQAENSHALEQQIERLKSSGATEIMYDVESGTKYDRASLNSLTELISARGCDEVVITRLDRLTRSLQHMHKIIEIFQASGVGLRSLDDAIDFSTSAGRFHLNMLGALAEMESDRLGERVRHGWAHLRDKKVAMNPPFGYMKMDDRHHLDHRPFLCLLEDKQEFSKAALGRELISTFLAEKTLRLTMREINLRFGIQTFAHNNKPGKSKGGRVACGTFRFSPAGLSNWLTNPVLQGHMPYLRNKGDRSQIHYDTHPDQRMISDEEFRQIEEVLQHNKLVRGFGTTALRYPLSGLVFCGECRGSCYSLSGAKNYHKAKRLGIPVELNYYFQCSHWRSRACNQKSVIQMGVIESAVISALVDRTAAIVQYADRPLDVVEPPELLKLRDELRLYKSMPGDRAKSVIQQLEQEIDVQRRQLQNANFHYLDAHELLTKTFSNPLFWETVPTEQRRQIYRDLVGSVVVRDGKVETITLKV